MRRLFWLGCLVGCYSPAAPEGLACAPASSAARCPAGQECVSRGGLEVCEHPGGGSNPDAAIDVLIVDAPPDASSDAGPPSGWWNLAWKHRRPFDIVAGANGAPAGYSVAVTFDHASDVAAGASLASGNDVRVVLDGGAEVDRVLDSGAAWDTASTKLWFRIPSALVANGSVRYWLYDGNSAAAAPPSNPSSVFLLADGFEGTLGAWSLDNGVVKTSARAHRGTSSVVVPVTNGTDVGLYAMNINERNVAFDTWWNVDVLTGVDMSQGIRGNSTSTYLTNLQPPSAGAPPTWNIAKYDTGAYTELVPPPSGATSPAANTWFRVTMYAYEDKLAVDINGARYVPSTGFTTVPPTTGTVSVSGYVVPAHLWVDDATTRRFVLPEPALALGATQSLP